MSFGTHCRRVGMFKIRSNVYFLEIKVHLFCNLRRNSVFCSVFPDTTSSFSLTIVPFTRGLRLVMIGLLCHLPDLDAVAGGSNYHAEYQVVLVGFLVVSYRFRFWDQSWQLNFFSGNLSTTGAQRSRIFSFRRDHDDLRHRSNVTSSSFVSITGRCGSLSFIVSRH